MPNDESLLFSNKSQPIDAIYKPFQHFAHQEASGGIVLLIFTMIALVWANSPWGDSYHHFWYENFVSVGIGTHTLSQPLELWINDGLMAIFFFVVGLEIKREVLTGELASPRQAMFPIAGALGGMIFPALIYTAFNYGTPAIHGWGVPMATDIAFALGILALLGDRVPVALKVFLAALAIVDDLGAVLVIALFYTSEISFWHLGVAGVLLLVMILFNKLGVRDPLVYAILGIGMWLLFMQSGVHATIAGVLAAMAIPASTLIDQQLFIRRGRYLLDRLETAGVPGTGVETGERQSVVENLEQACEHVEPPLQRLERALHPWVAFVIMPVFALANAGVHLGAAFIANITEHATLGIIVGLVLGKQIGVTLFAWLSVKLGLATLPAGATWKLVYGIAWLAGIGFTMSLFIAGLAFEDAEALNIAKEGILSASLIAGVVGYFLLGSWTKRSSA